MLVYINSEHHLMKYRVFILAVLLATITSGSNLSAYLYLAQFKSPTEGPYLECYLNVMANSVTYKPKPEGGFYSKLNVLYLFKQNGEIKAFQKYTLESPIVKDSLTSAPNFTDVQRIALNNGIYNFEVIIEDAFDTTNVYIYKNILTVDMNKDYLFSDIEYVETYKVAETVSTLTKNNYDIIPYVSSFYPTGRDTLTFYTELYNSNTKGDYLFRYFIENSKKDNILNQFSRFKKVTAQAVTPILASFDISDLPTGNYNLVLQLKNRDNKILTEKKFFFQRFNSSISLDNDTVRINSFALAELTKINEIKVLKEFIKSCIPIFNQRELFKANNILATNDIEMHKTFFDNFWKSYSSEPASDWQIYKQNVELVNRSYTSQIKKGYETDRGRVYLKYGRPNDINKSDHEPSSYPYEIWHYFALNGQTDIKFVFYNPNIVGEDYQLLHSNMTGELNNQYWQRDLTRRNSNTPLRLDDYNGERQYGNRAHELYNR